MVHWYTGTLVHWYTGTLVHWYTGTLVHLSAMSTQAGDEWPGQGGGCGECVRVRGTR